MPNSKWFPMIESDGTFSEEFAEDREYILKNEIREISCIAIEPESRHLMYTRYDRLTFMYCPPNIQTAKDRILEGFWSVTVSVFVHENFYRNSTERTKDIERFINETAPWVFSYGKRAKI